MFFLAAEPQPTDHVRDVILIGTRDFPILTLHMVTLVAASGLFLLLMRKAAQAIATGPESQGNERFITKGRFAQMIEAMILWFRDEIIGPILGEKNTKRYLPFLMAVFFFIWFNNLLGLVPLLDLQHLMGAFWGDSHFAIIGGTATGNLMVTAALALVAFIVIQAHGIRELGIGGWAHHLLGGAPWWLAPLMVPIELAGMIIKPAALAIRLFANMLAGHTLLATLLLFLYMAMQAGLNAVGVGAVGLISGIGAVAIYFLEIFVATLQAFIFMFLTTVFISLMSHHDDHEHEHEEHHGAEAAAAH